MRSLCSGDRGDPERKVSVRPETLKKIFKLTFAEAELARHLLEGRDLSECAGLLNISLNTANERLKSIFRKTNARRHGSRKDLCLTI